MTPVVESTVSAPETKSLVRQWNLLTALSQRHFGLTLREMAEEAGVTQRTIRRDLAVLQEIGFPLSESVSEHGRKHWRMADDRRAPALGFTWDEAIALFLGRRFMEPLTGTQLGRSYRRAFQKICATLGDSSVAYLEKMSDAFYLTNVGVGNYGQKEDLIDQLMVGIEDRVVTLLYYQSARSTEPVEYEIYPYGIVFHRGSLYLVAHSTDHGELRHFKVDRMRAVEPQHLKFERPAEFDLRQHLADSFGVYHGTGERVQIRIRFAREVAVYVEESMWHPTQKITREPDGGLLFEVELSETEEIMRWVLSFGSNARVIAPPSMVEAVKNEIMGLTESYRIQYGLPSNSIGN